MSNLGLASLLLAACSAPLLADDVFRVSLTNAGGQANGNSGFVTFSADGRYAAFDSSASNLVTGDTNFGNDIFVRDRQLGTTKRVSLSSSGAQGDWDSYCPMISADGRYVLFSSYASNLVPNDFNNTVDVFLRDLVTNTTEMLSIDSNGVHGNGASFLPTGSADMRYVVFVSDATNLDPADTNGVDDIFVRDRVAQTTTRITYGPGGIQSDGNSIYPILAADGRYVTFSSYATNLVVGDVNGFGDVFRCDLQTGVIELASLTNSGALGLGNSEGIGLNLISSDGRFILFASTAPNLVANDNNAQTDVFVRDMTLQTTVRASVGVTGQELDLDSLWAAISDDGRYVAFESNATNVGTIDPANSDVFLRDLAANTTTLVSASAAGVGGNQSSFAPTMTPDGRHIGFNTYASNLITGDTNFLADVYVRSRCFVEFTQLGAGTVGSGGFHPNLAGVEGACAQGFSIEHTLSLGGTAAILFIGTSESAQNILGGTFFVNLAAHYVAIPFTMPGAAGVPGVGSLTFANIDLAPFEGSTLVLQLAAVDPAGVGGGTLSNGLRIVIDA